ncbi:MAG: ABC transporter permease [Candidatus Rokuibacteriota bacterium]
MGIFLVRRLLQTVPVIAFVSIVVFLLMRLIPGDPAVVIAGPDAEREVLDALRAKLGLNEPLPVQYVVWLSHILRGDFGVSYSSGFPVSELLAKRFPATLELTLAALVIGVLLSFPLGIAAALHHRKRLDFGISVGTTVGLAVPEFWSGILMVIVFAVVLKWLPPGGRVPVLERPLAGLESLVLPAVTLALPVVAAQTRFVRAALLQVFREQYIQTAHAKGLRKTAVVLRHALRNALIPVVTVIGIQLGRLLGGAVLIETVFNWPGVGRLMVVALADRDYTVVQATLLVLVVTFSLINLTMDIVYGVLDPRIRQQGAT